MRTTLFTTLFATMLLGNEMQATSLTAVDTKSFNQVYEDTYNDQPKDYARILDIVEKSEAIEKDFDQMSPQ